MTTKNLETIIIGVKIYLLRSAVKSHTYGTISCPSPQKNLQRTAHLCLIFANIGLLPTNFLDLDILRYFLIYMRSQSTLNYDFNGKNRFFQS